MTFSERIIYERHRLGLTQFAFAEYIGCSRRTLQSWEYTDSNHKEPPDWVKGLIFDKINRYEDEVNKQ